MLKGNSFSRDTEGERTERLIAFSGNIGDVAVELGLPADKLAASEGALDVWEDVLSASTREAGEAQEATEELNKVIKAAYDYYVGAKAHLMAVINEIEYPDKIIIAYGFDDDAPTDCKGLRNALKVWIDEHAVLAGEGDPRIVNDTIIAKLTEHYDKLEAFFRLRLKEKDEAIRATETKRAVYTQHSKLLSFVHSLACLTWGDDDSRLRLIGMVPSSEVHTPGGGASPGIGVPENLTAVFGEEDVRITWDAVEGADGYYLSHTQFPPLFLRLYEGEATEFLHEMPDNGTHYYRVRAKVGDESGEYCDAVSVDVVVEAPPAPTKLKISLGGDNRTKVTWDSPSGVVYNGCSLYSVDVPTGSPVPARPSDPIWDELIVYSITMGELAPGMTRYVWVTGTLRGAESEATGPESVSL